MNEQALLVFTRLLIGWISMFARVSAPDSAFLKQQRKKEYLIEEG